MKSHAGNKGPQAAQTLANAAASNAALTGQPDGKKNANVDVREVKPTTDEIRRRAYEIYLERQGKGHNGSADTDWGQAERELVTRPKR